MSHLKKVGFGNESITGRRSAGQVFSIQSAYQRSPIFQGLSASAQAELASGCTLIRVARRRRIYAHGERGGSVFLISQGRVRIFRSSGGARLCTVAYRSDGEIVGETVLAAGQTYRDTAVAAEPAEIVQIPLSHIEKLIGADSNFAIRLLRLMVERCLDTEQRLICSLANTIESRLVEFLLESAERYGIPESRGTMIGVRYTHQEIADYIGATRETVTLILGELRRKGLILVEHRRILLVNKYGLEKLADGGKRLKRARFHPMR